MNTDMVVSTNQQTSQSGQQISTKKLKKCNTKIVNLKQFDEYDPNDLNHKNSFHANLSSKFKSLISKLYHF